MSNTMSNAPRDLSGSQLRLPGHVVFRSFPGETVILNLRSGKYHGVNPTGGPIHELLERGATVAGVAEVLAADYDRPLADVTADVESFCAALVERGLLVSSES
jgi:hypothetical protein